MEEGCSSTNSGGSCSTSKRWRWMRGVVILAVVEVIIVALTGGVDGGV